jgi:site-specific recombinase XerD
MAQINKVETPLGTSLRSLVAGFVLTKQTEGKSPRTIEYYGDNLRRFIWYAGQQGWSDDIRQLTQWHIKEFLGYVGSSKSRWGLTGNGSETSKHSASLSTTRHYFVILSNFFRWLISEGFISDNPISKIKVSKPKPRVIAPYSPEEIGKMLSVCDMDYTGRAKLLGSRNRALALILLDTGIRLAELVSMSIADVDVESGKFKVLGKGGKERMLRLGKTARKALWRYMLHRPQNGETRLWLSEEGRPLDLSGVQCMVKRLKERAGVHSAGGVHRFRHTFALEFLRADKNVFNLQYLLGHSDLDMVRKYVSTLGMEDALMAHEKASPGDLMCSKLRN